MNMQGRQRQPIEQIVRGFTRLGLGQRVVLIGATLGLLASVFSWYGASTSIGAASNSVSIDAWHDWGYVAILGFAVAGALVLRTSRGLSVRGLLPSLPPRVTDAWLITGAGLVSALAVIIFMLTEGTGSPAPGISEGPSLGAYLGLLCGAAIALGGYLMARDRVRPQGSTT